MDFWHDMKLEIENLPNGMIDSIVQSKSPSRGLSILEYVRSNLPQIYLIY